MIGFMKNLRSLTRFPLCILLIIAATFEWLEYFIMPVLFWPNSIFKNPSQASVRILILADPQLLGYKYTISGVLGSICRWDADRYVRKTFVQAFYHVNPDVVVFLGDLMDEGEIASDVEFITYFERFKHIFQEVNFKKAIIVPGDNDIGGEGEPVSYRMTIRFNKHFREDVLISYKFIDFVKINALTRSDHYHLLPSFNNSSFRIVLSHLPLTTAYNSFVAKVIPHVQPHIILSAHDHKSQHYVADRKTGAIIQKPFMKHFTSINFNVSETTLHEIIVPTCSYRMGTPNMGYGMLEIGKDGEVFYSVLWLPSRFRQLYMHLLVLLLMFLTVFVYCLRCCRRRSSIHHNQFLKYST